MGNGWRTTQPNIFLEEFIVEKQNGTNTVHMTGKAEQTAKENATKFKLPV